VELITFLQVRFRAGSMQTCCLPVMAYGVAWCALYSVPSTVDEVIRQKNGKAF